ncbi:Nicotinate-nucleotide adenylyltransferase [hydrothermal vent metagenome]|uniref:Nicotinate-nucleotide adenylyltransferase n=1 Tax=hydrothermal vent metagenome TaxID=652676 RepID=A0A3B0QZE5_9ZZZZ
MAKAETDKPAHRSARAALEQLAPGMRVGLFGGSFHPAHIGHLHVAETARKRLGLSRVLWLVSPGNPLKQPHLWQGYAQRAASARTMTAAHPGQFVCESEQAFGTRYTVQTVRGFQARWPGVHFVWIMGADSLQNFHLWRDWQQLAVQIPIAIISRPGDLVRPRLSPFARRFAQARLPDFAATALAGTNAPAWVYLPAPMQVQSSTAIRQGEDKSPMVTVPRCVRTADKPTNNLETQT